MDATTIRSRTWATVALFLPRCRARHTAPLGHQQVRCILRMGHRIDHRSWSTTWPRTTSPWTRRWRRITRWLRLPVDILALAGWWAIRCLVGRRGRRDGSWTDPTTGGL
jgi:hypothetical protein